MLEPYENLLIRAGWRAPLLELSKKTHGCFFIAKWSDLNRACSSVGQSDRLARDRSPVRIRSGPQWFCRLKLIFFGVVVSDELATTPKKVNQGPAL
jgi:hypothetical protein